MFFILLTISLSLLATGIILIMESAYAIGGVLVALAVMSFFVLVSYYKKKKKNNKENIHGDSGAGVWDCVECSDIIPKKLDCDCSPDCSS